MGTLSTASTIEISKARGQLSRLAERVTDEHVIFVTSHGKRAFALVDVQYLQAILETIEIVTDPDSYKLFMSSLEDIKEGRLIDHEDLKRELL